MYLCIGFAVEVAVVLLLMRNSIVSIIIPCFNQSQYLTECLKSVVAQTARDWEAIVVDDASRDGDAIQTIVAGLQDSRIRLVRHEQNGGLAAARNTGVRHSSAETIAPLDADDKLAPTYLEVAFENLRHESVGFIYFDIQCFGGASDLWCSMPFDPAVLIKDREFIQGTAPLKRVVWEQSGGWCEEAIFKKTDEDVDFWLSAVERGFIGKYVAQPLYHYRSHSAAMSSQARTYVLPIYRRLYERHRNLILRYSSYSEWMARGWLEVAKGHLHLKQPHRAFACGMWVYVTSRYRRPQAFQVMRSSLLMARYKIAKPIKSALSAAKRQRGNNAV